MQRNVDCVCSVRNYYLVDVCGVSAVVQCTDSVTLGARYDLIPPSPS